MRKEAKEIERQEAKKTKKLEKQRIKKLQIERKQAKELAKAKKKYGDWESNTKALSENDFEYNGNQLTETDIRNIILLGKKAENLLTEKEVTNKQ